MRAPRPPEHVYSIQSYVADSLGGRLRSVTAATAKRHAFSDVPHVQREACPATLLARVSLQPTGALGVSIARRRRAAPPLAAPPATIPRALHRPLAPHAVRAHTTSCLLRLRLRLLAAAAAVTVTVRL